MTTYALWLQRRDLRRAHTADVTVAVKHSLGFRGSYLDRDGQGKPKYLEGQYELEIAAINRGPEQSIIGVGLLDRRGSEFPRFDPNRKDKLLGQRQRVVERHNAPLRFLEGEPIRAFVDLASGDRFESTEQVVDGEIRRQAETVTLAKRPYRAARR